MNLVMISPGYPVEMAFFTRALAAVGATVIGLGDQPPSALPEPARNALAHYEQVNLADEGAVLAALHGLAQHTSIDQVECLWEPYMILAARIRESFGLPGMTVEQTLPFRDKERMKVKIDAAGIRTPRHVSATTVAEVWEAAEQVGYPLIVKPIAGAGSADTYRVDSAEELAEVLPMLRHVPEVSVEEFIDGEEFTYDTVCAGGSILYENIMWYRPRPLQMKSHEWISPASIVLRDLTVPDLQGGRQMGGEVLPALEFRSGFTHMEWYRKADGEAVFGEIGGRPPGARAVDLMNYATDGDLFVAWAEAVVHGQAVAAAGAQVQLRLCLQARQGRWANHSRGGLGQAAGRVRRARGGRGPAADRCPSPRLAGHPDQRRDDHRAASRAATGDRDDRAIRLRTPHVRRLSRIAAGGGRTASATMASRGPRRDPTGPPHGGCPSPPAARRAPWCPPARRWCPPTCPVRTPGAEKPVTAASPDDHRQVGQVLRRRVEVERLTAARPSHTRS